jgi:catalase
VLSRALQYWKNIDAEVSARIEKKVRKGGAGEPAEGMGEG